MAAPFTPTAEMIDAVSDWRAHNLTEQIRQPIVPLLCERFGLRYAEAVAVIRAASKGGANASH